MYELVGLVEQHRPDVLFLGDLRTPRNKIGRQRMEVERRLGEEWFLLTDIGPPPGHQVGVGAMVHSSMAKHKEIGVTLPTRVGT